MEARTDIADSPTREQGLQASGIFFSYSHRDDAWMKRLRTHLVPHLRSERKLDLWVDTRLRAGDHWFQEIHSALRRASVAVILVSAEFLASEFIWQHELPAIISAAERGDLQVLWVHVSPASYEETAIAKFQAAHDPARPLIALSVSEQEQVLKNVARMIKEAALRREVNSER